MMMMKKELGIVSVMVVATESLVSVMMVHDHRRWFSESVMSAMITMLTTTVVTVQYTSGL